MIKSPKGYKYSPDRYFYINFYVLWVVVSLTISVLCVCIQAPLVDAMVNRCLCEETQRTDNQASSTNRLVKR